MTMGAFSGVRVFLLVFSFPCLFSFQVLLYLSCFPGRRASSVGAQTGELLLSAFFFGLSAGMLF